MASTADEDSRNKVGARRAEAHYVRSTVAGSAPGSGVRQLLFLLSMSSSSRHLAQSPLDSRSFLALSFLA